MSKHQHEDGAAASEQVVPTVSEVIGDGEDARRLVRIGAWAFTAWVSKDGDEPLIRDVDLAERLMYGRPRDIRPLIDRLEEHGKIGAVFRRDAGARGKLRGKSHETQIVSERWLSEEQALLVATQSNTARAWVLTRHMIRIFVLARHGLLPQQLPITVEGLAMALRPIIDQAIVEATAPLAVRIGEQMRVISELRHLMVEKAAHDVQVSSVLLSVATDTKIIRERVTADLGVINGTQADRIRTDITWLSKAWVALGRSLKPGSLRSARREIMTEVFGGEWGGPGQKISGLPTSMFPLVRAKLNSMRAKAKRALVRTKQPRPAQKQHQLPFEKPN